MIIQPFTISSLNLSHLDTIQFLNSGHVHNEHHMLLQYKQNGESPLVVMETEQALLSCQLGDGNQ